MTDQPRLPGGDDDPQIPDAVRKLLRDLTGSDEVDPQLARMLSESGIGAMDPGTLQAAMNQVQQMFTQPTSGQEGGISTEAATDVARTVVANAGDESVGEQERQAVADAVRIAGLWLDEVTAFEAPSAQPQAWSRAEWVEATMARWTQLTGPVAAGVGEAMAAAMQRQMGDLAGGGMPEGLPPGLLPPGTDPSMILDQMRPMVTRMAGQMFGMQTGQAVGALAADTLTGTEVGLPLTPSHALALLPANIAAFGEGLEVDPGQLRIYLAAREGARVRLFEDVAWLGPQLLQAVQDYARDITIDTDAIEQRLSGIDPSDAGALQKSLQDNLFRPDPSPAQQAALTRLETYLALVEGWVDVVADQACRGHLPQVDALGEAVRRRRATGGPAEKTFSGLVGLQLRPRRLRDAANLWAAVEDRHGASLRDAAWAHPDVAPTAADLDDPLGYVEQVGTRTSGGDDLDAELDRLLRGDAGADSPDLDASSGDREPRGEDGRPEGDSPDGSDPRG